MKLSSVYERRVMYGVAYPTGHLFPDGEMELEFVEERFFSEIYEACDFRDTFDRESFTDLLVIEVRGFSNLHLK